ncbi:MAG TPA: orotidine-5'-phosphate decarboxylase [Thermoanaerobaculia bacterium]|nr:orotidine-5'-phosphate decarboxylase [Thermoanaerobaculia bacterium]
MHFAHFTDDVLARARQTSPLVLGLDPDFSLMPPELRPAEGAGGEELVHRLVEFTDRVLEAAAPFCCAAKPQSAFFEQHGSAGVAALAQCLAKIRAAGLPILLDVKRGDIGSTATAYVRAYLGDTDLSADAVTVNPFLGGDSLAPFLAASKESGKGVFVLVKTSNPGSRDLMDLEIAEGTVSARLARQVEAATAQTIGESGYGLVGAVVGSTYPGQAAALRLLMPHAPILVPGLGAQGGSLDAVRAVAGADRGGILVPVSRGLTYPSAEEVAAAGGYVAAVRAKAERYAGELNGALVA